MQLNLKEAKISDDAGRVFVSNWHDAKPMPEPLNFKALLGENRKWVYKCASLNSQTLAAIPLRIYTTGSDAPTGDKLLVPHHKVARDDVQFMRQKMPSLRRKVAKDTTVVEVESHPLLDALDQVNPFMGGAELIKLTNWYQELIGNAYWYLVKDQLGVTRRIWLLPAENMKVIPSRESFIKGYVLEQGTEKIYFEPGEILHFKYSTPNHPFYGMSPLAAAVMQVQLDMFMDKFDRDLFANRALPEVVLTSEQKIDNADMIARIKQKFKAAFRFTSGNTAKEPLVLTNGLKVERLTMDPKDLHHIEGRKLTMQAILSMYGVPSTKVDPSEIKANSDAADVSYYRDTVVPRQVQFVEKLNEALSGGKLLPEPITDFWFGFEDPTPGDREFELKRDTEYVRSGIWVPDEVRMAQGKEPLPDGMGAVPLVQAQAQTSDEIAKQIAADVMNGSL